MNNNETDTSWTPLRLAAVPVLVVLFDLWKTIARGPYPEPIKLLKELLNLEEVSDDEFLVVCLTTPFEDPERYLMHISEYFGMGEIPDGALEDFRSLIQNEKNGLLLFTDVVAELTLIKEQGYRLGLVTNSWPFPVYDLLRTTGLDQIFEHVISSHEVGIAKQDGPEIYRLAAQRFGVEPEQCLMVGDNPALDVLPAHDARVKAVLIDRDGTYVDREGKFKDVRFQDLQVTVVRNLNELSSRLR